MSKTSNAVIEHLNRTGEGRAMNCTKAPDGWRCSRESGHDGPCAAWRIQVPDMPNPPPPPPKAKDPAAALAARISTEPEWQPSTASMRDAILRRFTERLDAVCATAPDRLNTALAVIVQAGPGRTVLVISDPAAADFVTELRRHVEADEPSPLTALLQSRLPI